MPSTSTCSMHATAALPLIVASALALTACGGSRSAPAADPDGQLIRLEPDAAPHASDAHPRDGAPLEAPPSVDGSPGLSPCNPANARLVRWLGPMAECAPPSYEMFNQCEAEQQLCNYARGFRLCPTSTYRKHFASTPADEPDGSMTYAWIGGCVRTAGIQHQPTDARCPVCAKGAASVTVALWRCNAQPTLTGWTDAPYIGVASFSGCHRVGVNQPHAAAYWVGESAAGKFRRALCCRP